MERRAAMVRSVSRWAAGGVGLLSMASLRARFRGTGLGGLKIFRVS